MSPAVPTPLFQSFWMGGFECSTHRRHDGRRLDMLAASRHDQFALQDYCTLQSQKIRTVRDGLRWHLIETSPFHYDWSSVVPMLEAARQAGTQVIWDLCHYGWPDDLDIFSSDFPVRFGRFAGAFAKVLGEFSDQTPFLTPVNEISYFAWAGGRAGIFYPFYKRRAHEIKRQLVRATIEAIEAIWQVTPHARIVQTEPLINVASDPDLPSHKRQAEVLRRAQFAAFDMLTGLVHPELGGQPQYLDIIGANYYIHNQWIYRGARAHSLIPPSDSRYCAVWKMLRDLYQRYQRPVFLSETSIEFEARPVWLRYIAHEIRLALKAGVPLQGLCWYPIFNHPGWVDERHCQNGMWDYADANGNRPIFEPLAREWQRQQELLAPCLSQTGSQISEEDERELDIAAAEMESLTELSRR